MGKLKAAILVRLLTVLMEKAVEQMSTATVKQGVDRFLDWVEDNVQKSPNKWDDAAVLPLCKKVREVFDIPDND
jgi:hypothetical protein